MKLNEYKLIIYIPTYNRLDKLRTSLEIISREIIGFEDQVLVYVSNNASTDGTGNYLKSFKQNWLYFRENKINIGGPLNFLHCFELPIKSEFVWLIGDDDYLLPDSISGILSLIKNYSNADYIFCNTTAFRNEKSSEILKNYLKTKMIEEGTLKSRKITGTFLVDFEQLIDPEIADTLLCELMVNCFRQSSIKFDINLLLDYCEETVDWDLVEFDVVGKIYSLQNQPFLNCFKKETKAVYCDVPRTFNFWGSAKWLIDYDYIFPIAILSIINQYKEKKFISNEKYFKLLDYYYSIMRGPLIRQITSQSSARPFNSLIKAKMFDFLLEYQNYLFERKLENNPYNKIQVEKENNISLKPTILEGITSIIILTFNQLKYTKECLKSIRKYTPEPHEIIFVDNGSTDGTVKYLKTLIKENKNYKLIENKENLGFAKGCNQGISNSSGEYLLLLNNDVIVTEHWLSDMLSCLKSSPEIGIVGPMTNNISGLQKDPNATYPSINELPSYAKTFREQYRYRRIPFRRIVGFCMLFRRSLIDKIGLFDENFGTGNFEDDDLCLRSALEGFQNFIAGDVFIHHYGSRTFIGNKINYSKAMNEQKEVFSGKWDNILLNSDLGKKLAITSKIENAGEFYIKGEFEQAIKTCIEGIGQFPEEPVFYLKMAELLLNEKNYQDAIEALDAIPDQGTDDVKYLSILGYCKEGLGSDDEAENIANRILTISPGNAKALNLKGVLSFKIGKNKEGEEWFAEAVNQDPGQGEPYTYWGALKWKKGQEKEGLELLERGFILSPNVMDCANLYHSGITEAGEFNRGVKNFRSAQALYPSNQRICFLLIDLLIRQGKDKEAMEIIEEAMASFEVSDGLLQAALKVREKIGPIAILLRPKKSLSISMIVKNEEKHIIKCLRSVKPIADEIIVVDTGSSDRTKEIARALGAQVFDFEWKGDFSKARNYSLSHCKGSWIFSLDADEVVSSTDYKAVRYIVEQGKLGGYWINTRNYSTQLVVQDFTPNKGEYPLEETGLGWFPSAKVRLFPNGKGIHFENPVHEYVEDTINKAGLPIIPCSIPVHHYGRLDEVKLKEKGEAYYQLGKKKLKEKGNTDLKALFELAVQAGELNRIDEAVSLFERLVKLEPKYPLAQFNLGTGYFKLQRFDEAIVYAQNAYDLNPDKKECAISLANCMIISGDISQAKDLLEFTLQKHGKYPPSEVLLAITYSILQKLEGYKILEALHKQNFDCSPLLHETAELLSRVGRFQQALQVFELIIKSGNLRKNTKELLEKCYQANGGTEFSSAEIGNLI
jgi:GT2 family glycosyltransferase/predicted Zn-dependent protease